MKTRLGKFALKFSTPLVIVGALFLASCDRSDAPPAPPPAPPVNNVSLADVTTDGLGYVAPVGTIEIAAGGMATSGSVTFMCAVGGMDCTIMVAADGTVTSTGGMATAMNSADYIALLDAAEQMRTANTLFGNVAADRDDVSDYDDDANDALEKALKYSGMLDVISVGGESAVAKENAEKVLAAKGDVDTALANANAVLTRANGYEEQAMALDEDTPRKAELLTAIDDLQGKAGAIVSDIEDIQGMASLKSAVTAAMDPAKVGAAVAKAISDALAHDTAATPAGTSVRVTHTWALPTHAASATMTKPTMVVDAPASAKTWEEIVGETMTRQITTGATAPNDTRTVKVASIEGQASSVITIADLTVADNLANGAETDGAWKGIPGVLICGGADCAVTDNMLTGSWYFTPTSTSQKYSMATGSSVYSAYNLYATYGHWLSTAITDGVTQTTVNTFATSLQTATAGLARVDDTTNQATYEGDAIGMSTHDVFDGTTTDRRSGSFEADVNLTATFNAADSTVEGTIDNFRGGAVGAWSVDLESNVIGAADNTGDDATSTATGSSGGVDATISGTWTARAYGGTDAVAAVPGTPGTAAVPLVRPVGIFGGFAVQFPDGSAAGAYATRRED